jgi:hypothetical protein
MKSLDLQVFVGLFGRNPDWRCCGTDLRRLGWKHNQQQETAEYKQRHRVCPLLHVPPGPGPFLCVMPVTDKTITLL